MPGTIYDRFLCRFLPISGTSGGILRFGRKIDYPTLVDLDEAEGLKGTDKLTEPANVG